MGIHEIDALELLQAMIRAAPGGSPSLNMALVLKGYEDQWYGYEPTPANLESAWYLSGREQGSKVPITYSETQHEILGLMAIMRQAALGPRKGQSNAADLHSHS